MILALDAIAIGKVKANDEYDMSGVTVAVATAAQQIEQGLLVRKDVCRLM
jgi:hypothetical protein